MLKFVTMELLLYGAADYSQLFLLSPKMLRNCGKHNFPRDKNDFHGKRRIFIELNMRAQFSLSLKKCNAQNIDTK